MSAGASTLFNRFHLLSLDEEDAFVASSSALSKNANKSADKLAKVPAKVDQKVISKDVKRDDNSKLKEQRISVINTNKPRALHHEGRKREPQTLRGNSRRSLEGERENGHSGADRSGRPRQEAAQDNNSSVAPSTRRDSRIVGDRTERQRYDRHSRGPRRSEGEKKQNVGKGNWGRPIESQIAEAEAESTLVPPTASKITEAIPANEEADPASSAMMTAPSTGPSIKTLNEYLAEQRVKLTNLTIPTPAARRPNEGAENVELGELLVRPDEAYFSKTPSSLRPATIKKTIATGDYSTKKAISLAEITGSDVRTDDRRPIRKKEPISEQSKASRTKIDWKDTNQFPTLSK